MQPTVFEADSSLTSYRPASYLYEVESNPPRLMCIHLQETQDILDQIDREWLLASLHN
jgi:hypothetical protein